MLIALGLGGLVVGAAGWFYTRQSAEPTHAEFATVVRFGISVSEIPTPLVTVRTDEGVERQLRVGTNSTLVHCRRGSRIRLLRKGEGIYVDPRGCGQVRAEVTGAAIAGP